MIFLSLSAQKSPVSGEAAPPAGDLSEEVDEAQVSGVPPLGEEEGYDADSESNPEDSTRQEEGSTAPFILTWESALCWSFVSNWQDVTCIWL